MSQYIFLFLFFVNKNGDLSKIKVPGPEICKSGPDLMTKTQEDHFELYIQMNINICESIILIFVTISLKLPIPHTFWLVR